MEPRAYFDPPSEREWTIAEMEELFAGQDGVTGIYNTSQPPRGVHITHIVPPEQGWPVALYCPIWKETTFILSPWAIKPKDGDYWKINSSCGSDTFGKNHNAWMSLVMRQIPVHLIIEQEMTIEEAKRRYPNNPIPGQECI